MPTTFCLQSHRDQIILFCLAAASEVLKIDHRIMSSLSRLNKFSSFSSLKSIDCDHCYPHHSWGPVLKEEIEDTTLPDSSALYFLTYDTSVPTCLFALPSEEGCCWLKICLWSSVSHRSCCQLLFILIVQFIIST